MNADPSPTTGVLPRSPAQRAEPIPPCPGPIDPDPWGHLRRFTAARIALGRAGGSQPTRAVLNFRLAHARARDAVLAPFDLDAVLTPLANAGVAAKPLNTAAADRQSYLLRPDLGRRLDLASAETVDAIAAREGPVDLALIVSDGLAAAAAERHAAATLFALFAGLADTGWKLSPVFVVRLGRVKLQDEIGQRLKARFSLMLLGERPGLGTSDSLGAYFTAGPAPERTDADRNCVSNIRPEGIPPDQAGAKLAWLLKESARSGRSGIHLKDTQRGNSTILG